MKLYVIKDKFSNEYFNIEYWYSNNKKELEISFIDYMRTVLAEEEQEEKTILNLTDNELFDFFNYEIVEYIK